MSAESDIMYSSMRIDETFEYKWKERRLLEN